MLRKELLSFLEETKEIRRYLHQVPEEGFCEYKTSEYIFKYLKKLGINNIIQVTSTGLVAIIEGKHSDKTIAFRADMDGLSVTEKNTLEYSSTHEGMMHACGHDGHMTTLLVFAKYILDNNIIPDTNIMLVFQPAEEGPGGAKGIIETGIFQKYNVEKIYGFHIMPTIDEGIIGYKEGPLMAQTGEIYVTINGKSSHAAVPHRSVDAIVITANLISALQTIVSRNMDPIETTLLSIGTISGGSRVNVIADKVEISGTMRAFHEETYENMKKRLMEILRGYEKTYNCVIECEVRDMYPPVINEESIVKGFEEVTSGMERAKVQPMMISEDFSYYQKEMPGMFFYMGSRNEDKDFIYDLHDSKFNFNESILLKVVEIYLRLVGNKEG